MAERVTEAKVKIAASAEEVWNVLSDVERWYEWTASIKSILLLDPKPLHVGSKGLVEQPSFPRTIWQVTELVRNQGFNWEAKSLGAHTIGEHWITPDHQGGVNVVLRVRQTGWLAWIFQGWIGKITREYVAMEAKGLKLKCEQAISLRMMARGA
ncbi:MAG TPA: SRPBCC family protein [Terriglobales bacterium]|nr:SRPBCC family protein [Terriglobales bacterium]